MPKALRSTFARLLTFSCFFNFCGLNNGYTYWNSISIETGSSASMLRAAAIGINHFMHFEDAQSAVGLGYRQINQASLKFQLVLNRANAACLAKVAAVHSIMDGNPVRISSIISKFDLSEDLFALEYGAVHGFDAAWHRADQSQSLGTGHASIRQENFIEKKEDWLSPKQRRGDAQGSATDLRAMAKTVFGRTAGMNRTYRDWNIRHVWRDFCSRVGIRQQKLSDDAGHIIHSDL